MTNKINSWDNVGFPIAEIDFDGTTVISKAPNTGGLVSVGTVAEQLVYEIHDAANYILPDVVVDFTQLKLEQVAKYVTSSAVINDAQIIIAFY